MKHLFEVNGKVANAYNPYRNELRTGYFRATSHGQVVDAWIRKHSPLGPDAVPRLATEGITVKLVQKGGQTDVEDKT